MLYGVETSQGVGAAAASDSPWNGAAVTFHSALLRLNSLSCIDNEFFGFAGWFQNDWSATFSVAWAVDPFGDYLSSFFAAAGSHPQFEIATAPYTSNAVKLASAAPVDTAWHHIICAGQTNFAANSKIIKMKIDGVDSAGTKSDPDASFNATSSGVPFWVGADDPHSDFYSGSMAELSIWPGISLLTSGNISAATVRLFRNSDGTPANPSLAIAALGAPPIWLSGGAATFADNTFGTSGPFTISTGTLSDAAPP